MGKTRFGLGVLMVVLTLTTMMAVAYAAAPGFDDKEIRIASWGPMTGPAAPWGTVNRGPAVLCAMVNEAGGIHGRKLKHFARDDQYNPAQTKVVVKDLVERQGVFAFVAGTGSACGMAVKDYLLENKIIWVAPAISLKELISPVNPYIFALMPLYEDEASILTKYVVSKLKMNEIGVLYQNDAYGKAALGGIRQRLDALKMKAVAEIPVEATDKDPQWVASETLGDFGLMHKISGGLWEGVITAGFVLPPESPHPLMVKYREAIKKFTPEERPGLFYIAGSMFTEPLVDALKRAGKNLSTEAALKALNSTKNFQGIGPKVNWTADQHQGTDSVQIWKCGPGGSTIVLQDWTSNELATWKKK
jgi:ABC-type branched-subunit amino acid transport system substrate-binding protein